MKRSLPELLMMPGRHVAASQASRAGIIAASANIASTFARGLLPRSVLDQAIATGVISAAMYEAATTAHAAAETFALYTTGEGGMRGRTPDARRTIAADLTLAAVGASVAQLLPPRSDEMLPISITRFVAQTFMVGGLAGTAASCIDYGIQIAFPKADVQSRPLMVDVAVGGALTSVIVFVRHRQAHRYGLVDPERRAIKRAGLVTTARAAGIGTAAAAGMLVLAAGEQTCANAVKRLLDEKVERFDIGSPLVGHAITLGAMGIAGTIAFSVVKKRVEHGGDIVEPAYQEPPASEHVTAGPRSLIAFDEIGMEGRRFVLMACTPEEITSIMNEPAIEPVRVVAGFEAAPTTDERAELCLREMIAVGAFERSLICIASPTGVGYISYTIAESLEYLTLGDCAIVVPQYALVPSALAIFDTHDGVNLQRRVIELTKAHIDEMPAEKRPRLVQFGESLGAQVALDVAYPHGSRTFDELGLEAGLYLGVPFRSTTWNSWQNAEQKFDPDRNMVLISEPSHYIHLPERRRHAAKHVMVVHDDDPVNKFTYRLIVKPPWWMGPPATRPPKVPRETVWRPVTTFLLTTVDLLNGMDFKPGLFVRRGHDYRIDALESAKHAFTLTCTEEQSESIEAALRARETAWAARRMVARRFAKARASVATTLKAWGVKASTVPVEDLIPELADIDPASLTNPHHYPKAS